MNRNGLLVIALAIAFPASGDSGSLRRGQEAFQKQDWPAAEREFTAAIREQPDNALAYKSLGMVYASQEKFQLAEEPFRQACELNPREELACYYLGRTYYTLNRYEESRAVLEKTLGNWPDSGRIKRGLGLTLEALGHIAQAGKFLKESAQSHDPGDLSEYGQFLFRQGSLTESIAVLKRSGDKASLDRAVRALEASPNSTSRLNPPAPVYFKRTVLPMIVRNGAIGEKHQIETMIAGVAVFDYDGDGWPDIYITNGATSPALHRRDPSFSNRLFRNNRDGTFTDVTATAGVGGGGYCMGVAVADYDNDGRLDLFVTGVRENFLYKNRGDGTFEDVTAKAGLRGDGAWSIAAGWFDYDNDGRLDLFVVRYVVWDPSNEPYCGGRRPGYRTYCHPNHYAALPNALYRNQGDGTFRDVSRESGIGAHQGKGMGVAFGDYDQDGLLDVFVANDTAPNFLFHNLGNGKLEDVALNKGVAYNGDGRAVSSMGADFRDYDNDGWEDIFVTALATESFTLFRNLRGAEFREVTQAARIAAPSLTLSGWSTGIYDFNNDGFKDIFTANSHANDNVELSSSLESRQANSVFLNRGDGSFEWSPLPDKAFYRGAAFGDFNRDGKIDVVVTRLNAEPLVLMNATQSGNHWLQIRLRGRRGNRDGLGARIHVITASGSQWNRITTSVGYAGSSDPVAHFGLGRDGTVRLIEVEWPSGARSKTQNVSADRYLEIEETG